MKNSWTGGEAVCSMACAEENLALAVHRMETGAFERLIDRHESSLFNFAHSILQNTADAQEVVQDAMLRAHRALTRQYDEARCAALAMRPWLLRITRNLCLNCNRSKMRALEQPLEQFDDGRLVDDGRLGPFVRSSEADLEHKQEMEALRGAMARVPVEARELIVLRFIEEMSYADIARTVGGTEASLRGKVFRSLKLVREALERKEISHAL
jgi:RNA polymerase sigma-70 factor, ECF subfamily